MKVLEPNNGKNIEYISTDHLYVKITDYKKITVLKEVIVAPGQHSWEWIELKEGTSVDVSRLGNNFCTFDNAINKSVNNFYCTIYEFDSLEEMIGKWKKIKYNDNIITKYKIKE
jgi:hypothetical protein